MSENPWLKNDLDYGWETCVNADWIIRDLEISGKDRVLDVGCAAGAHLSDIEKKTGASCVGVDIRTDLFAWNTNDRITLKYSDMRALDIADRSITRLFSLGVFEHVPETERVLFEVERVLTDDGRVLFSVPNKISLFHLTKKIKQAVGFWKLGYEKGFTVRRLKAMLARRGLRLIKARIILHSPVKNLLNRIDNLLNGLDPGVFGFFIIVVAEKNPPEKRSD